MSGPQDEFQPGTEGLEAPTGPDTTQNDYTSRTGQKDHMPVQSDDNPVEDPIDPNTADSDEQLGSYSQSSEELSLTLTSTRRCRRH